MISQLSAVRGNSRRFRRNQVAEMNAKLGLLPAIIQAKQNKIAETRAERLANIQKKYLDKQNKLMNKQIEFAKKQQRIGTGIAGIGLGLNFLTSDLGGRSFGNIFGTKKKTTPLIAPPKFEQTIKPTSTILPSTTKPGIFSGLSLGSAVGGGLGGFGLSRLAGDNKMAKLGLGAAGGALLGGLGNLMRTHKFSFGNTLLGGLTGLLGGLL